MKRVMVRYKVKANRVGENEELIREVFRELAQTRPVGIRYASFKLDDGVSFVHIASIEAADGNPLTEMDVFRQFQANIKDRCEEPPVAAELTEIGNYEVF